MHIAALQPSGLMSGTAEVPLICVSSVGIALHIANYLSTVHKLVIIKGKLCLLIKYKFI